MLNSDAIIAELAKHDFDTGWIDPEGNLHRVQMYQHFPLLQKNPRYTRLCEAFTRSNENEQEDSNSWTEQLGPDDHPCWHAYWSDWEDPIRELRRLILSLAYHDGYIRWTVQRSRGGRNVFSLECTRGALDKNFGGLRRIAEKSGLALETHTDVNEYDQIRVSVAGIETQLETLGVYELVRERLAELAPKDDDDDQR